MVRRDGLARSTDTIGGPPRPGNRASRGRARARPWPRGRRARHDGRTPVPADERRTTPGTGDRADRDTHPVPDAACTRSRSPCTASTTRDVSAGRAAVSSTASADAQRAVGIDVRTVSPGLGATGAVCPCPGGARSRPRAQRSASRTRREGVVMEGGAIGATECGGGLVGVRRTRALVLAPEGDEATAARRRQDLPWRVGKLCPSRGGPRLAAGARPARRTW